MPIESMENQKIRMKEIVVRLKNEYPESRCSLIYKSPFQLLVATILSAQCTDERVNKVTPGLFEKADTPAKMAVLSIEEIMDEIRSCGLAPTKAKNIKRLSALLAERYGGGVPQELAALKELPGVGHKTASVVVAQAFGIPPRNEVLF